MTPPQTRLTLTHEQGDPKSLILLKKNARFMRTETFRRLTENIRDDGVLTQWPFVWHDTENDERHVLSGNHRVRAAIEAGLEQIDWTECADPLPKARRLATQLSHNAIAGEDDPTMLAELYAEIGDVDQQVYAGLDDKTLGLIGKVDIGSLAEASLDYTTVLITFLPAELTAARKALEEATGMVSVDQKWLAFHDQHRPLLDALVKAKDAASVVNIATGMMVILDVFNRHLADLRDEWYDEEEHLAKHDGWIGLDTFGLDQMPAEAAATVAMAVEKMQNEGQITRPWQALEYWAADYLGGR